VLDPEHPCTLDIGHPHDMDGTNSRRQTRHDICSLLAYRIVHIRAFIRRSFCPEPRRATNVLERQSINDADHHINDEVHLGSDKARTKSLSPRRFIRCWIRGTTSEPANEDQRHPLQKSSPEPSWIGPRQDQISSPRQFIRWWIRGTRG
jgi:hypothetical protein